MNSTEAEPALAKLSRRATPGVQSFAFIAAIEALVRGTSLSVYPLVMYRVLGSAAAVSEVYFMVGLLSLTLAFSVPTLARRFPRNRVYTGAVALYVVSAILGAIGGKLTVVALLCNSTAAAAGFVCFNAYVLDYVAKTEFGRLESLRMLYGGLGWVVGPALGVWLLSVWSGAPFVLVGCAALAMLGVILHLQLGRGREMTRLKPRASHPIANLQRFIAQPRLVAGWFIPLMRSCGWWCYFVYVGIFALENGMDSRVGGYAASAANLGLLLAPLMLRWMQRRSVRHAVRTGTLLSGLCFVAAALVSHQPWATVAMLVVGTVFLVLLDVCAGLPFLMAVKPSERTEMSAVYSSFRDASGILSPGIAWAVLQFAPVAGVFAAGGLGLIAAWWVAGHLHPQLGIPGASRVREGARERDRN